MREKLKIGVLGGGQLGLMLHQANDLDNVELFFLDPNPDCPCANIGASCIVGDFNDYKTVLAFGQDKDIVTIEIENVNVEALLELEKNGKRVFPQPKVIATIKDKGLQKRFYQEHNIPTANFSLVEEGESWVEKTHFPIVQKLRTGGYDGRGVQVLQSILDREKIFSEASVIEEAVKIQQEISVIVARNKQGELKSFPPVGMEFNAEANLVDYLFAPAELEENLVFSAIQLAEQVATKLEIVGILAVELFLDSKGNLIVNEVAPRPHNSGHHTIEACETSQYKQLLNCLCGIELGNTKLKQPALMLNLLGEIGYSGKPVYTAKEEIEALEGVFVHVYGKNETKPFRKMGHVTILKDSVDECKELALQIKSQLRVIAE